jgi:lipoyl(octanoyl) transferase
MTGPILRSTRRPADYAQTLAEMRAFTRDRTATTPDTLWQVEHPPVYTLGLAGLATHILNAGAVPVVRVERGGQVTYHGPGQIVVYTLLDIRRRGIFVKDLVCRLEQAIIDTLTHYGIQGATRKPQAPGVYVLDPSLPLTVSTASTPSLAKIAAIGLKVSQGRTYHGIALNLAMNLEPFSRINPCGYAGLKTVDMATMGVTASWQEVADTLCDQIDQQLTA